MIDKLSSEFAKLLTTQNKWRIEAAFNELESILIELRTDVSSAIACEVRVESTIERTQRVRMSEEPADAETTQCESSTTNLQTLKEATALHRQILHEAEMQTQVFYTLKQWTIPMMTVLDTDSADAVCLEYSALIQKVVTRLKRCRKPDSTPTQGGIQELRRQLLEEASSRQALEELVVGKMHKAIRTFETTGSGLPPLNALMEQREEIHSRLKVSRQQVLSWSHRAQMAAQQNETELARAAIERQRLFEKDCASIDMVLAALQEAIFAINPDAPLD